MKKSFSQKELNHLLKKTQNPVKTQRANRYQPSHDIKELLHQNRKIKEKRMNKTEEAFARLLNNAVKTGEILRWHFEHLTFKLAPNTRYTPDFLAVLPSNKWHIFEIKGHLEDDAAVKFKTVCDKFPEISFQMIRKKKEGWETIYNLPANSSPIDINSYA